MVIILTDNYTIYDVKVILFALGICLAAVFYFNDRKAWYTCSVGDVLLLIYVIELMRRDSLMIVWGWFT